MKVMLLSSAISGQGGMETAIKGWAQPLAQRGVQIELVLLGGTEDERWLAELIGVSVQQCIVSAPKKMNYVRVVRKKLLDQGSDVIVAVDERAVVIATLAKITSRRKVPVVSWMHFSLTHLNTSFIKLADYHIALNKQQVQQFHERKLAHSDDVYLSYHAIAPAQEYMPRPAKGAHFIYIGRLQFDKQKRVNDLLHALHKVSGDWRLTVVGDGEDREQLQRLAVELNIEDRIRWLGWVNHPWSVLDEVSCLVLTSAYEGFGMVLAEAITRGVPCISADCPTGPNEIISTNINGWLIPPKNTVEHLASRLQRIVDHPHRLPETKDVAATAQKFNVASTAARNIDILQQVVQRYETRKKRVTMKRDEPRT